MPLKELEINEKDKTYITVVEKLPDYSNDPFFLKKRRGGIQSINNGSIT